MLLFYIFYRVLSQNLWHVNGHKKLVVSAPGGLCPVSARDSWTQTLNARAVDHAASFVSFRLCFYIIRVTLEKVLPEFLPIMGMRVDCEGHISFVFDGL